MMAVMTDSAYNLDDGAIRTLGHSNRSVEAFVALTLAAGIDYLIDVRS
jgi:hypothetical protein